MADGYTIMKNYTVYCRKFKFILLAVFDLKNTKICDSLSILYEVSDKAFEEVGFYSCF